MFKWINNFKKINENKIVKKTNEKTALLEFPGNKHKLTQHKKAKLFIKYLKDEAYKQWAEMLIDAGFENGIDKTFKEISTFQNNLRNYINSSADYEEQKEESKKENTKHLKPNPFLSGTFNRHFILLDPLDLLNIKYKIKKHGIFNKNYEIVFYACLKNDDEYKETLHLKGIENLDHHYDVPHHFLQINLANLEFDVYSSDTLAQWKQFVTKFNFIQTYLQASLFFAKNFYDLQIARNDLINSYQNAHQILNFKNLTLSLKNNEFKIDYPTKNIVAMDGYKNMSMTNLSDLDVYIRQDNLKDNTFLYEFHPSLAKNDKKNAFYNLFLDKNHNFYTFNPINHTYKTSYIPMSQEEKDKITLLCHSNKEKDLDLYLDLINKSVYKDVARINYKALKDFDITALRNKPDTFLKTDLVSLDTKDLLEPEIKNDLSFLNTQPLKIFLEDENKTIYNFLTAYFEHKPLLNNSLSKKDLNNLIVFYAFNVDAIFYKTDFDLKNELNVFYKDPQHCIKHLMLLCLEVKDEFMKLIEDIKNNEDKNSLYYALQTLNMQDPIKTAEFIDKIKKVLNKKTPKQTIKLK